jgi:hypothetical protein
MKIAEHVKKNASEQRVRRVMEKLKEFAEKGSELCAKPELFSRLG